MKKISSVNCWLGVGIIVSMYVLTAKLCPNMQIPFSFLDEEGTLRFNDIMEEIAISYLVGVIIYFISVTIRNKIIRKQRKWELYDALKDYQNLEDITKEKWTFFGEDRYKELTSEQVSELVEEYDRIVKVLHRYDNILTEEELDCLHDISKYMDFEVYHAGMEPIEIEKNVSQIAEINKCIVKLQSSFTELIKH